MPSSALLSATCLLRTKGGISLAFEMGKVHSWKELVGRVKDIRHHIRKGSLPEDREPKARLIGRSFHLIYLI